MSRLFAGVLCVTFAPLLCAQEAADCADCPPAAAFELNVAYTGEMWSQVSGGVDRGNRYLDNLEVTAFADAGLLFGLDGLTFFGYALYNNGHVLADDLSGAMQGVSNIEAVRAVRLYELWSQWEFGTGEQSVRFGLYDLNSEFDSIESAGLFINPSHGIGPDFAQSGQNGPSIFPITALAVRAMKSFGQWSVQAAALDGVPGDPDHPDRTVIRLSSDEGALLVGQVNYAAANGLSAMAGYWQYTADFDDLILVDAAGDPIRHDDNAGFYAGIESPVLFARGEDRGMRMFLRAGQAQADVNPIEHYVGAGAVYSGPFAPARDQIGVAIAVAKLGQPYRTLLASEGTATEAREYNYELTYRFEVTDGFALQTDAQYIVHPGMDPELRSGWTLGLRFEVSRGWSR